MSISVVIPFHERTLVEGVSPCRLARVLNELNAALPHGSDVICVDDHSPVSCESLIRDLGARYVRTTAPRQEPHVARRALARQLGLDAAIHDVVLFLDSDILVPSDLIGKLLTAIHQHGPQSLIFVPRHDVSDPTFEPTKREFGKQTQLAKAYSSYVAGRFRQPIWARQSSHCFAVMREFVQSAGGWDMNFVGWGEEDTELFYRLWAMGGKIVTLRTATVGHLVHPIDHEANYGTFSKNARYFMQKHPDVAVSRRSFYRHFGILQDA